MFKATIKDFFSRYGGLWTMPTFTAIFCIVLLIEWWINTTEFGFWTVLRLLTAYSFGGLVGVAIRMFIDSYKQK